MSVPIKLAVGVVGLGGATIAGCHAMGIFKFGPTSWVALTSETNYSSEYGESKVGKDYGRYLVATHGIKKEGENDFNKKWWEESYGRYKKDLDGDSDGLSTEFGKGKVTQAYKPYTSSGSTVAEGKELNLVCKDIYGKQTSEISFDSGEDNKNKLGRDLLKYCSPLDKKPSTVATANGIDSYKGKIGETKKSDLVSVGDANNWAFWDAQGRWFEVQTDAQSNEFFKQFFEDVNQVKKLKISMKGVCGKAYESEKADSTTTAEKPTESDVVKYCSFAKEAA